MQKGHNNDCPPSSSSLWRFGSVTALEAIANYYLSIRCFFFFFMCGYILVDSWKNIWNVVGRFFLVGFKFVLGKRFYALPDRKGRTFYLYLASDF